MSKAFLLQRAITRIDVDNIWVNEITYDLKCGLCNDEIVGVVDNDTGFLRYVHDADNTDICDF